MNSFQPTRYRLHKSFIDTFSFCIRNISIMQWKLTAFFHIQKHTQTSSQSLLAIFFYITFVRVCFINYIRIILYLLYVYVLCAHHIHISYTNLTVTTTFNHQQVLIMKGTRGTKKSSYFISFFCAFSLPLHFSVVI